MTDLVPHSVLYPLPQPSSGHSWCCTISDLPGTLAPPLFVPRVHQLRRRDHLRVRAGAEGGDGAEGEGGRRGRGGRAEGRRQQERRRERRGGGGGRSDRREGGSSVQLLHALTVLQRRPSPANEKPSRGCVYTRGEHLVPLVTIFMYS